MVVSLLAFSGVVADVADVADVAVGTVGAGAQPGDQDPRICVDHRDVTIGWDADPVGINALDYRSGLYAFAGEQLEYTILIRDPNGALDIGFPKIMVDGSPEVLCNELTDAFAYYRSVNLCQKDTTTWECLTGPDDPSGILTYVERNGALEVSVSLSGLDPNSYYQLAFQGRTNGDGNNELATICDNPNAPADGYDFAWECGMWGTEGFWNFEMEALTDGIGNYQKTYLLPMPLGHYGANLLQTAEIGFIVKEAGTDPETFAGPWDPVMMEESGLDWTIRDIAVVECDGMGEVNTETDRAYHCLLTVEPQWDGEKEVNITAYNSVFEPTDGTHVESWYFNPSLSMSVSTSDDQPIRFETMPYGADTPEERTVHSLNRLKIKNNSTAGVNMWMYISGTDLYDNSGGAAKCPTTNKLSISNMKYRGWTGTQWTSWEGWTQMSKYDQNENCDPITLTSHLNPVDPVTLEADTDMMCYGGLPVPYDPNALGPQLSHILTNSGDLEVEFKLTYPMPCVGSFNQGLILVFGKAV